MCSYRWHWPKNPIENTSMHNIFANLFHRFPSERGLQNCSNVVGNIFQKLSAEQLQENQKVVNKVMSIWCNEHLVSAAKIAVVADNAYHKPVKDRAFTQRGTQAWLPMLCAEKNMEDIPVVFSTWRKLCSCPLKYNKMHETGKCTKTFPSQIAMGSSEKDMCRLCLSCWQWEKTENRLSCC